MAAAAAAAEAEAERRPSAASVAKKKGRGSTRAGGRPRVERFGFFVVDDPGANRVMHRYGEAPLQQAGPAVADYRIKRSRIARRREAGSIGAGRLRLSPVLWAEESAEQTFSTSRGPISFIVGKSDQKMDFHWKVAFVVPPLSLESARWYLNEYGYAATFASMLGGS